MISLILKGVEPQPLTFSNSECLQTWNHSQIMRFMNPSSLSRRRFIAHSGCAGLGLASAAGLGVFSTRSRAANPPADSSSVVNRIADPEVRAGVDAAITKNLIPAAVERLYPGHFLITADGGSYGGDATWPGLDSWQMSGAYLLLGRTRLVVDYFDFVRASQRKDGNIPFAIFGGETKPGGFLRGLKSPEDVFTYEPPRREGLAASSQAKSKWIGLFEHWQPKANPLSTLGAVCYVLTAGEIYDSTRDLRWLRDRLPSIEAAARYLQSQKHANGLISGSGFYTEGPPRYAWDGVTQCYVIHAFRRLANLFAAAS